jgi:hypothetical protein
MKFTLTLLPLVYFALVISCKKSTTDSGNILNGVWVEKTLRLDTIDFTINNLVDATTPSFEFKSNPFIDSSISTIHPIYNGTIYYYKLEPNAIELLPMTSSSLVYRTVGFTIANNKNEFTIGKFYIRSSLPDTIGFIKL